MIGCGQVVIESRPLQPRRSHCCRSHATSFLYLLVCRDFKIGVHSRSEVTRNVAEDHVAPWFKAEGQRLCFARREFGLLADRIERGLIKATRGGVNLAE